MKSNEKKTCPRCKKAFPCKAGDVHQCDCSFLSLTEDQQDFVESRYDDCLCKSCLFILKQEFEMERQHERGLRAVASQTSRFVFR